MRCSSSFGGDLRPRGIRGARSGITVGENRDHGAKLIDWTTLLGSIKDAAAARAFDRKFRLRRLQESKLLEQA
jgi:hypothetical protein